MASRVEKHTKETRRKQAIKETNRVLDLARRYRISLDQSSEMVSEMNRRGAASEQAVERVFSELPGVQSVRRASEHEDINMGIDLVVKMDICDWKVQVKSNPKATEMVVVAKQKQWQLPDLETARRKMALRGWMAINGSVGAEEIGVQIASWINLRER